MKRVHISVEGQTEETFIRDVLQPYFDPIGLYLTPVLLKTRRVSGRPTDKGGYVPYSKVKREILALLGDTSAAAVTTMYDLYALPESFPGLETLPEGIGIHKAEHLEAALSQDIGSPRFHPYIQLHEFEALLFTSPEHICTWLSGTDRNLLDLRRIRQKFPNPEEIDDDPDCSPSHRIRSVFPEYEKNLTGSLIAIDIGLDAIREACKHFDAWIALLEEI